MADHGGAAGEDMFLAKGLRWPEGNGQVFPVNQVLAAHMAPVHVAPVIAIGVELIKEVIPPLEVQGAVWVVQPK